MNNENNIYCRKCTSKVANGIKCTNCQCVVNSYDLTTPQTCPACHTLMQESVCRACGYDIALTNSQEKQFSKLTQIFERTKKGILACALIAAFLLGFGFKSCTGIKKSEYEDAIRQREVINESNNKLLDEYNAYKEKMQPYEAQQEADAKVAEEQAKKEAEEKAAQEAEMKRQAEEQAKANTFGITPKDFITQFNVNCATLGSGIVATIPSNSDTFISVTTSKNNISLDLSVTKSGYVSAVFVNYTNLGDSNGIIAAQALVAAAQVVDNSTNSDTFAHFFNDMIRSATYGQDYEQSLNGVKYRINYEGSSLVTMIYK